jgi:hypothetical protein
MLSANDKRIISILEKIKFVRLVLITTLSIMLFPEIIIHICLYFYPLHNAYEYIEKIILPSIFFFGATFVAIFCSFFVVEKIKKPHITDEEKFKAYRAAYYKNRLERYFRYVICFVSGWFK